MTSSYFKQVVTTILSIIVDLHRPTEQRFCTWKFYKTLRKLSLRNHQVDITETSTQCQGVPFSFE